MKLDFKYVVNYTAHVNGATDRVDSWKGVITPPVETPVGVITHFDVTKLYDGGYALHIVGYDSKGTEHIFIHNHAVGDFEHCKRQVTKWLDKVKTKLEKDINHEA